MPHNLAKMLQDVIDACCAIESFVDGKSLEDYRNNLMMRSAVERQFEIIGEAINRLYRIDPQWTQKLTSHRRIIAFRNIIAHGYDMLDPAIVWQVIQENLPTLLDESRELLEAHDGK